MHGVWVEIVPREDGDSDGSSTGNGSGVLT